MRKLKGPKLCSAMSGIPYSALARMLVSGKVRCRFAFKTTVLFVTTCNDTPATAELYKQAVEILIERRSIEVVGADGVRRRSAQQIKASDQLVMPAQRSIFDPTR
jgi:hypothetical protein